MNSWLNQTTRLDYIEYTDERDLTIAQTVRRRSLAQERVSVKRLAELSTIRYAVECSETEHDFSLLHNAQHSLAIARAARDTLVEEEKLATVRITEAELRLSAMQEDAETIRSKRQLADKQIGILMHEMEIQGLPPDYAIKPIPHRSSSSHRTRRPWVLQPLPSPHDSEPESDYSDFESYYDAPNCNSDIDLP